MKWLVIKNKDVTLEMNIIYYPYLLYDLDWTKLSPNWTAVSIVVKNEEGEFFREIYREYLKTDEILQIVDALSQLIGNELHDNVYLSFYEPNIHINIYPESVDSPVEMRAKGDLTNTSIQMRLTRDDTVHLYYYLSYISGSIHSNDERIRNMQQSGIIYDEWCWFLTGRIPGFGKVYVLPVKWWWHDDEEDCVAVWCRPNPNWYAYKRTGALWGYIKDYKVEKIYLPKILYNNNYDNYWGKTEKDYQRICRYAEILNEENFSYSDTLARLDEIEKHNCL